MCLCSGTSEGAAQRQRRLREGVPRRGVRASCLSGLALTSELGFLKLPSVNPPGHHHTDSWAPLLERLGVGHCDPPRGVGWRRKWQPTPVLLPGEFHGQRSLVGSSPQGLKEPDTAERLSLTQSLSGVATEASGDSVSGDQPRIPALAGPWAGGSPCSILGTHAQAPLALPLPLGS